MAETDEADGAGTKGQAQFSYLAVFRAVISGLSTCARVIPGVFTRITAVRGAGRTLSVSVCRSTVKE